MGWLVGATLASLVASFVALKLFDYVFAEAHGVLVSFARVSLFVITWTAITARAGMHSFKKGVRQLRHGHTKVAKALVRNL